MWCAGWCTAADHARYELAEHLTEHHHHLICELCGSVRDVTLTPELERRLDEAFATVSSAEGFTPTHHTIDLYGRCADCRILNAAAAAMRGRFRDTADTARTTKNSTTEHNAIVALVRCRSGS